MSLIKAKVEDLDLIEKLLKQNDLPYQDVREEGKEFFLAYNNADLIGVVGLETFKDIALLRSMIVKEEYRNKSYGKQIFSALVDYVKTQGIIELYLLTTTAEKFFKKLGFQNIKRDSAPEEIKQTSQFSTICPSSAVCLKINFEIN